MKTEIKDSRIVRKFTSEWKLTDHDNQYKEVKWEIETFLEKKKSGKQTYPNLRKTKTYF